ncbi:MAG: M50 family metallopeptidase [Candidatus Shapirobacteria bacterium]
MLLTVITFLLVLSVLVLVHEGGHFLAAKKAGIKVEEFGVGYPPRIFARKIGGTEYSLNLLPLGGFVRLYGEDNLNTQARASFWAQSKKARASVIFAGVTMNFLLAIFVFAAVYSVTGLPVKTTKVNIVGVVPGSPADQAGLKVDQRITALDGVAVKNTDDFIDLTRGKLGREVVLEVDGQAVKITPRQEAPAGEGPLGVVISSLEMKHYPFYQMIPLGIAEGFKEAVGWGQLILASLGKMFLELFTLGRVPKDVAGPLGILQITSGVAKTGWLAVAQFMGILSVNLAVINILPFPALDGGRLVFLIYELVTRRRPRSGVERWVNTAGMATLLFLIMLVTIGDVSRLFSTTAFGQQLSSQFRSLWPF